MSFWESIFMGIIQGATEFLPVSSSGHLAIFKNIFGIEMDTGIMFDIMLHFGTLVAIFIVYWKDIVKLVVEGFTIIGLACCNVGIFFFQSLFKRQKEVQKSDRNRVQEVCYACHCFDACNNGDCTSV